MTVLFITANQILSQLPDAGSGIDNDQSVGVLKTQFQAKGVSTIFDSVRSGTGN
jgi:hypothetical protein